MPDQNNTTSSSNSIQPNKLAQKIPSVGTKSSRKNNGTGKESGGDGASVTKNKPFAQSGRVQSPEMKPVGSPSNGNPITSPVLDALSSAALDQSSSQNTSEWAKNILAFSSSPGTSNLINLGESPPALVQPSSYEGWTARERGVSNGHISSASPPSHRRRPLSYQLDGNYTQGFDEHRSQMSSYAARRSSMYSQHSRYAQHPPLPHQPQPHFYGVDANLMLSPPIPGLVPGDKGFYCGFDSLLSSSQAKSAESVIVAGYEGGINIYAVSRRGLHKTFSVEGLRGGVFSAKILPWSIEGIHSHHFPLIVAVVHGPVWASSGASSREDGTPPSEAVSVSQNDSVRGSPRLPGQSMNDNEPIEYYQTSVEVYSLRTKQHVATLLSVPKVHLAISTDSPLFVAPPPVGSLTIHADKGSIIIASGTTGETWIFRQTFDTSSSEMFRCIGKVWTTVQHGLTLDPAGPTSLVDGDWQANDPITVRKQYKTSILSISGRWLAFCPPTPSSQASLRAAVPSVASTSRVPGLNAFASPQLPNVNCMVELPGGESMMKHIVQIGTQKFIEAGNMVTDWGLQAWNTYRNKASINQPSIGDHYQLHSNIRANVGQQFPPTHGIPTPAPLVTKDPGLISILDLEALAHQSTSSTASPHPMATFKVPHGCSFLSFAPSGLALFTASSKGDVQTVWDLMRIQYAKSSFLKAGFQGTKVQGPHVRQIAQFSRMTIARIVDVVWTSPHGERAAMVTEPGTVHILDLPASAFTWPPPRRRGPAQKPDGANGDVTSPPITATGLASSAVSSLWTAAQPLVSRRRRSSVGISAKIVTAQAGHGTQALAAGISRSVGAATGKMNEMRRSGHTKLHLPNSIAVPSRACILLVNGKRNDSIMALAGGIVRFYSIKNRRADRPVDKQKASRGARYAEFRIPNLPDFKFAPEITRGLNQVGDLELTERDIEESRWKTGHSPSPKLQGRGTESSIPQAEIESNAPYQPFHTDRRVGLHIFSHEDACLPSPSVSALLSSPAFADEVQKAAAGRSAGVWAFGGSIRVIKLDVGPPQNLDDDLDDATDHRALPSSAIERVLRVTDSTEEMEQIVITTRRRKGVSHSAEGSGEVDEEGFFEDDCEVLDFASQRV